MCRAAGSRPPRPWRSPRAPGTIAAGAASATGAGPPRFRRSDCCLEAAGALAWNATRDPSARGGRGAGLVRAVARADASVGRIFDGHLNGSSDSPCRPRPELRDREFAAVRAGGSRRSLGRRSPSRRGPAGDDQARRRARCCRESRRFARVPAGLDRALVLARDPTPGAVAVWIDLDRHGSVHGRRGLVPRRRSACLGVTRVVFDRAPVMARFGPPGSLSAQPWFGRDALRTAASWAGWPIGRWRARSTSWRRGRRAGPLEELAAGRMLSRGGRSTLAGEGRADDGRRRTRAWRRARVTRSRGDRRSFSGAARRGGAGLRFASVRDRRLTWIGPGATWSCSCSSTGSIRRSPRRAPSASARAQDVDEAG